MVSSRVNGLDVGVDREPQADNLLLPGKGEELGDARSRGTVVAFPPTELGKM